MPSRAAGRPTVSTAGWRSYTLDGADIPLSPAGGPARRAGGLASGFADTPAGAVLAAANIAVRVGGQLGPAVFAPTIGAQVTGASAPALLAAAWQEYGQAGGQDGPAGPATATITSFLLSAWSPAQASVTLVAAAGGGSRAQVAVAVQVQWLGGDWRMTAPAGGTFTGAPVASPAPPGFTPMPGA